MPGPDRQGTVEALIFHDILFATDFSETSRLAGQTAAELARHFGARLELPGQDPRGSPRAQASGGAGRAPVGPVSRVAKLRSGVGVTPRTSHPTTRPRAARATGRARR